MSRASETFRPRAPLVEAGVARDLVTAVITRAGLDVSAASKPQLEAIVSAALRVALDRREVTWAARLADLRRHSLTEPGKVETSEDRARVALDVRLGVARLLAAGITSTRGAWCDLAAAAVAALTAGADGLLRRELLAIVRDVRAEAIEQLSLESLDLLAELTLAAPTPARLGAFAPRLEVTVSRALTRLQAEVGARMTAARTIRARPVARATRAPSAAEPNAVDGLLTIDEACRYLGLSRSALYRRLADPAPGSLRTIARPLPGSGHLRFDRAELDAWSARDKKRS